MAHMVPGGWGHAMVSFINTRFAPAAPITMDHISFATGVTALNEVLAL
jgi:hypothetical protein